MPGDTLIFNKAADSIIIQEPLFHPMPSSLPQDNAADARWFFGQIAFFILLVAAPFIAIRLRKKYLRRQAYKTAQANFALYDEWLADYNGYYKSLPAGPRQKFLERVAWFMAAKTFTCVDLPQDEKMPLLISAAAVQISFGLDKYLLDFFDTIYIMRHNYKYGLYDQPFEGHVNSNGIYLSWDNFLSGYENYTDADNVGIHEMAHALAYVNFMAEANDGQDNGFIKRFYQYASIARPIFADMQKGKVTLLNEYAATNYNEFWAVAVETFFERSLHMKVEMPDLYETICNLLNQDPLLPEKILTISSS